MNEEIITIEIDSKLKEEVENIFTELGIDTDTAVNLFLEECIKQGKIPFDIEE